MTRTIILTTVPATGEPGTTYTTQTGLLPAFPEENAEGWLQVSPDRRVKVLAKQISHSCRVWEFTKDEVVFASMADIGNWLVENQRGYRLVAGSEGGEIVSYNGTYGQWLAKGESPQGEPLSP